mmetsp:Transcript_21479/g.34410  ORF Transcript_21479/g.34410 Transcript_21479/m.34410 type:complete len:739 (+) Transcript_21479:181-2397(+)|eukprot:CAMPEP_0197027918 /NCGR_PEP_ID=MMETSP1384-20130603/7769_1 /TAXON_ID=29189 /ORGANISM="Ammonia sp." /LENGTH=738 /DNA_ID=CAMNT_0042456845 /DNA_START=180 /DNA_END=2396 /DNA_ORIENTATION=+
MGQCGTKLQKEHVPVNTHGARRVPATSKRSACCLTPPPVTPIVTTIRNGYGGALPADAQKRTTPAIHNDSNIHNEIAIASNLEPPDATHHHTQQARDFPARIDLDYKHADCEHVAMQNTTSTIFRLQDLDLPARTQPPVVSRSSVSSSFGFETLRQSARAHAHYPCHENGDHILPSSIVYHRHGDEECKTEAQTLPQTTTTATIGNGHGDVREQSVSELQNELLLQCKFTRTLFCEDITYEYEMQCEIKNTAPWICRLTVETLTKFYLDAVHKWQQRQQEQSAHGDDAQDVQQPLTPFRIPCQFGKVMTPKVFSSLMGTILQQPAIFREALFAEQTANFLMIPHELRCLVQYNPYHYVYGTNLSAFRFCDVICNIDEKFKYLCHSQAVYRHDYEYDDCCQCYDEPQVTSYSYWIRSLQHKIDLLVNCTSNNIFSIVATDLPFNIMNVLKNDIGFDENSAWIITDYLPKYLLFNHHDERCNAHIVYKFNQRDFCRTESEIYYTATQSMLHAHSSGHLATSPRDQDDECFVMDTNVSSNKFLQRHKQLSVRELQQFCKCLCVQHTAIKCVPEMTPSVSEYIESMSIANEVEVDREVVDDDDNAMNRDNTFEHTLDTVETEAYSHRPPVAAVAADAEQCSLYGSIEDDQYEVFFNAFIDEEGEDDINICQWLCSLSKLNLNLTEKEIVAAFKFIGQQSEEDHHGFVDFIDFTGFCRAANIENGDAKKVQQSINRFICRNST